jgi:hypothetical protein
MSAPTKPFANGYGILLGIVILWAASVGAFWIGKIVLGMVCCGDEAT